MDFLRAQLEPNLTRVIDSEEIISCKRGSGLDEEGHVSRRKLRHNKPKADKLTRLIYNSETWIGAAAWDRYQVIMPDKSSRRVLLDIVHKS